MTDWNKTLAAICPESLCDDGNHLAACIGASLGDLKTFNYLNWKDASGNIYSGIQTLLKDTAVDKVNGVLEVPEFDTGAQIDMARATNAQSKLRWDTGDVIGSITCSLDKSLQELAFECGLVAIPVMLE